MSTTQVPDIQKVFLPPRTHKDRVNIVAIQDADRAAWVWHPELAVDEAAFVVFRARFEVSEESVLRFHLSADQRYELLCDGVRVAKGPDRSLVDHWSYATYDWALISGPHEIEVHVWWLGTKAPEGVVTWRGGFMFKAEGTRDALLTTGSEDSLWQVAIRDGWDLTPSNIVTNYHVVGQRQTIHGERWLAPLEKWTSPVPVRGPVGNGLTGLLTPGWRLFPSVLPDQLDCDVTPGRFRALVEGERESDAPFEPADEQHPQLADWNRFLRQVDESIVVPAGNSLTLVWDLEDYYCAFAETVLDGGCGATLEWEWAESLFVGSGKREKHNRNGVAGKSWYGFGHSVRASGAPDQRYRFHWWNAGRFCRLRIRTGEDALVLKKLVLNQTRYPLEDEGMFSCSDPHLAPVRSISTRAMQMCSHDTYMDCPYYEQLMYVGDTRLEVLVHYMMQADSHLPRRAVELFDYSRKEWGFTTERVTSQTLQLCPTFSLIWIWMVRDYLYWRGELDWVRDRMIGVRCCLEHFRPYLNADGLLEDLPGWSFVDWVGDWTTGYPPGALDGVSSIVNLHYLLSLLQAADMERQLNEEDMAIHYEGCARRLGQAILSAFWDEKRGLLRDDLSGLAFSEHAQCLALLAGFLSEEQEQRVLKGLLEDVDLARATIYFSFYLIEVYKKYGYQDRLLKRLDGWRALKEQGFTTTPESPEPSRSDCHAWGAHPIYHMVTGLFGLQPTAPGMSEVMIRPEPADLSYMKGTVPSPLGDVTFDLTFDSGACHGAIELPSGMSGRFLWGDREQSFTGRIKL